MSRQWGRFMTGASAAVRARSAARAELLLEKRVELRGVGFPLRRFHRLTDKEAEQLVLTRAIVGELTRVARDDLVDHPLERSAVRDLPEALLLDDRIGIAPAAPHRLEHFLGELSRDGRIGNPLQQTAQLGSRESARTDLEAI